MKKEFIAKSGRKYRSIPDDVDIETWDLMTIIERLHHKGLIIEQKEEDIENCIHYDLAQGRHKCCHPKRTGKCIGECRDYEEKSSEMTLLTDTDAKEEINTDSE